MADQQRDSDGRDERVGRGVREGMDGGVSRHAHTSGERQPASGAGSDHGTGGYGDSSGYAEGTSAADEGGRTREKNDSRAASVDDAETGGRVPAQTRTDDVGKQAPSGMEDELSG